jgi:basic membrane protein A
MKKRVLVILMVLLSVTAGLFASGTKETTDSSNDKLKIGVILPGKVDDVSFNQSLYVAMKKVEEDLGDQIEVTYVEEVYDVADIEPTLRDFAERGYDLIFGHGFQFMEPLIKVAAEYPDTCFALGTGYKTLPNTCVYDVKLEDGGYLMGTLAASLTKTGKIGVIGGADASEIYRGHEAYKYAAKKVNSNIKIQEYYTGDWNDIAKAKEGALGMYSDGVDIIWHSGDGIGLGVVNAAKEANKIAFSNVTSQYELAPENVLSGINYEWEPIVLQIISDIQNDNFKNRTDKFYWISSENGGISVGDFHQFDVPEDVRSLMITTEKGLAEGTIEMPDFNK